MSFIDLSHTLKNDFKSYPGDPEFSLKEIFEEEEFYLSKLECSLHTGTHIDAAMHYIKSGNTVNDIQLDSLIGPCDVLILKCGLNDDSSTQDNTNLKNILKNMEIKIENLEIPQKGLEKIIILKTRWCDYFDSDDYFHNNPYLSMEFAKFIIENGVETLALDTPSPDKFGNSEIHKILLENDVNIIENLTNTRLLTKNKYNAYFIPLKIESEASFVRAFLSDNEIHTTDNEKIRKSVDKQILYDNLDKIHTTPMGEGRIKRNLDVDTDDVLKYCMEKIKDSNSTAYKKGKNYYVEIDDMSFTINSSSFTIITAHKN